MSNYCEKDLEYCTYTVRLLEKIKTVAHENQQYVDMHVIKKAIYYAKTYHGTQMRASGEPFYSHPLEVAYMLADYILRTDLLATAILHDTIEDTILTEEVITEAFGKKIAEQVSNLTRIKANEKISSCKIVESLWQQRKLDILLIKLLDRLHNLQTISAKPPEKIIKILKETLESFISAAMYLEVNDIEKKLVNTCRYYLTNQNLPQKQLSTQESILKHLISDSDFF